MVPGWYGMTNVKWLGGITVLDEPFDGYQHARGYRYRDRPRTTTGAPVTRMLPRALMVPPGIPDFMTRGRFVAAGVAHPRGPRVVGRGRDRARST